MSDELPGERVTATARFVEEMGYLGLALDVAEIEDGERADFLADMEARLDVSVCDEREVLSGSGPGLFMSCEPLNYPLNGAGSDEEVAAVENEIEAAWNAAMESLGNEG